MGINGLDKACKVHIIAYSKFKDNTRRRESDRAWVRYKKINNVESFGNLRPPFELSQYFGNSTVYFNYKGCQKYGSTVCGRVCLKMLAESLQN